MEFEKNEMNVCFVIIFFSNFDYVGSQKLFFFFIHIKAFQTFSETECRE